MLLIAKAVGSSQMQVVSYNTADFNVVTIEKGLTSGPYNNSTKGIWSPSAFPVSRFGVNPDSKSDEPTPELLPFTAGSPLATAEVAGVIHLAHPMADQSQIVEETFSISGVLTSALPEDYETALAVFTEAAVFWKEKDTPFFVFVDGATDLPAL